MSWSFEDETFMDDATIEHNFFRFGQTHKKYVLVDNLPKVFKLGTCHVDTTFKSLPNLDSEFSLSSAIELDFTKKM